MLHIVSAFRICDQRPCPARPCAAAVGLGAFGAPCLLVRARSLALARFSSGLRPLSLRAFPLASSASCSHPRPASLSPLCGLPRPPGAPPSLRALGAPRLASLRSVVACACPAAALRAASGGRSVACLRCGLLAAALRAASRLHRCAAPRASPLARSCCGGRACGCPLLLPSSLARFRPIRPLSRPRFVK